MTDFSTIGTQVVLFIIVLYFGYLFMRDILNSSNSLKNSERIHRFLLVVGGMLIGLGFGSLQISFSQINVLSDNFLLSILIATGGVFMIGFGVIYLRSSLWEPLENISEYSAEFGTQFIATRLPEAGDRELQRFSERFNENAIKLSNAISELEINVDIVEENIVTTVNTGKQLTEVTSDLSDMAIQYSTLTQDQQVVIQDISVQVGDFAVWYAQIQDQLTENFVELRSIAEMGNLIAINAAVEASNLDEPNPGIETLANRLRELARSLEERQTGLRRLLDDIKLNYDEFRNSIQTNIDKAIKLTGNTGNLSREVEGIIQNIGSHEVVFRDSAGQLERTITRFKDSIPTAYK